MAATPGIEVRLGRDLGIDAEVAGGGGRPDRRRRRRAGRADTLLVVVGRGTNDPDANSNIAKIARMLWEGMGFGWAEAAFSGVAHPRVDAALDRAARLGFRRIVVFPYFLFTGVLVKRIYARPTSRRAFPEIEFVKAAICATIRVIDAFVDRVASATPAPTMNCQLCKYRTRSSATRTPSARRSRGITITCAAPGRHTRPPQT